MTDSTIQPNAYVTLDYELRDDAGDLVDASGAEGGEPIRYVHGYGMIVPGLEAAIAGLRVGDERDVVVPADEGYGEYDEDLVLSIDRAELPRGTAVDVGDELVVESPDGEEVALNVVEVRDDVVVLDGNHPLAGITLHYHVSVRDVRDATEAEVESAAAGLDEAHEHVHGPDCDHTHEPLRIGNGGPPDTSPRSKPD